MSAASPLWLESLYHPTTLQVDAKGYVTQFEGRPAHYGLDAQTLVGSQITDSLPCLFGLPLNEPVCLNHVELSDQLSSNIHLRPSESGYEVLLIDATELRDNTQHSQQAANEVGLLYQKLERLSQELETRNAELDAANRAKSLFISSMSHEFRTPMISILGHLDWMNRALPDHSASHRSIKSIGRSARYLLTLIDNLLSQGKLEASSNNVDLKPVQLTDFFEHLTDMLHPLVDEKDLTLETDWRDLKDITVNIDEHQLHQVIVNLMSNAIKYTPAGRISLLTQHRDGLLTVRINDEGIGIPRDALDKLFEPFSRASNSKVAQGAGLGLAIAKSLIERMQGTLDIRPCRDRGTCVTLTIPAEYAEPVTQPSIQNDGLPPAFKTSVYILDDNPDILEIFQLFLREADIANVMFDEAESFISAVLRDLPELVITDYHLDDTNGIELCQKLRGKGYQGKIIIMTATAAIDPTLQSQATKAGADQFIPKPMDINRLVELVKQRFNEYE